jgi:hypothetical protein
MALSASASEVPIQIVAAKVTFDVRKSLILYQSFVNPEHYRALIPHEAMAEQLNQPS